MSMEFLADAWRAFRSDSKHDFIGVASGEAPASTLRTDRSVGRSRVLRRGVATSGTECQPGCSGFQLPERGPHLYHGPSGATE